MTVVEKELCAQYGFDRVGLSRIPTGVGGLTYVAETERGKFILKGVREDDIYFNNEPDVTEFLGARGIPVADFIKNKDGQYVWAYEKNIYHLQRFVDGNMLPYGGAPEWFMRESAETLGRIHAVLSDYPPLPVGMGESFFDFMKSERPNNLYRRSLEKAKDLGDDDIVADAEYRLSLVGRLKNVEFELNRFTRKNTHGDYKIGNLICGDNSIAAVIDWSGACVHPICWEIIRSFTYADPGCAGGQIECGRLIDYVKTYMQYSPLNGYDLKMMPYFFYHMLLACDYYGQYFGASDENKEDFLFQAKFATGLIRWLERNAGELSDALCDIV